MGLYVLMLFDVGFILCIVLMLLELMFFIDGIDVIDD